MINYHTISELVITQVILPARHVVQSLLHLVPHELGHLHHVRHRDAVLLGRPHLEDGMIVGELVEDEPLHGHAVVVLDL